MKKYEFLEHTADIKFKAYGKTLEEAFSNSAYALKEKIISKKRILQKGKKEIKLNAKNNEKLLYNFLEEFLYLLDAKNFIFSKIEKIKIKNGKLTATILGDKASNYEFSNNVKAVTYNEILIKKEKEIFTCQIVLDV